MYSPSEFKMPIYSLINISYRTHYYFHSFTVRKTNLRGYTTLNAYALFHRERHIMLLCSDTLLLQQSVATGCARPPAFILLVGLKI